MDYNDVRDEYLAWKSADPNRDSIPLSRYAQLADARDGANHRMVAYDDGYLKQANAGIDRFFRPLGNDLGQYVGKPIDETLGTGEAAQGALRGLPRAATEAASYFAGAGEASGVARLFPFLADTGAARRLASAGGMLSSALSGAAEDSAHPIIGAGARAVGLPVGGIMGTVGEKLAARAGLSGLESAVARGATGEEIASTVNPLAEKLQAFIGQNAGVVAGNEMVNEGKSLAEGNGLYNPLTPESIVGNVVGALPFLPHTLSQAGTAHAFAERRSEILKNFNDTKLARDKSNASLNVATADLPENDASNAVLQNTAKAAEEQTVADVATGKLNNSLPTMTADAFREAITLPSGTKVSVPEGHSVVHIEDGDNIYQAARGKNDMEVAKGVFSPSIGRFDEGTGQWTHSTLREGEAIVNPAAATMGSFDYGAHAIKLAAANAEGLSDVSSLAEWTHAVNSVLDQAYNSELSRVATKNKEGADFFADENRPGRIEEAPALLNPEVLKQLSQKNGKPLIDQEFYNKNFQEFLEKTGNADKAYRLTIQKAANVMLELGETAKKQASLEAQNRPSLYQKPSEQQLDQAHYERVKQLPEELQKWLADKEVTERAGLRTDTGKEVKTRGGKEQTYWPSRRDRVEEALKNYDSETGKTTIVDRSRGKNGEIVETPKEMTLDEAIKAPLKAKQEGKAQGANQKTLSLDAQLEKGQISARTEANQRPGVDDFEDIKAPLAEGGTAMGDQVGQQTPDIESAEAPDIAAESSSNIESDPHAEAKNRVKEIWNSFLDPANEQKNWALLRSVIWPDIPLTRAISKEPMRRATMGLALKAFMEGSTSEAAAEWVKKINPGRSMTKSEVSAAWSDFWNKTGAGQRLISKLTEMSGLDPKKFTAELDPTTMVATIRDRPNTWQSVAQSAQDMFRTHFRMLGYGPELVEHFAGIAQKVSDMFGKISNDTALGEVAITDPLSKAKIIENVTEKLTTLGLHGNYFMGPNGQYFKAPFIAIAVGHKTGADMHQAVANYMQATVLTHELLHGLESPSRSLDSYSPEMQEKIFALNRIRQFGDSMSQPERYQILRNALAVVIPPEMFRATDNPSVYSKTLLGYLQHGSTSGSEFASTYGQIYLTGIIAGGEKITNAVEAMRWEPEAVQQFLRGEYRDIADFAKGFAQMAQNPVGFGILPQGDIRGFSADAFQKLHDKFDIIARPDAKVEAAKQAMARLTTNIEPGAGTSMMQSQDIPKVARMSADPVQFKEATEGLKEAHGFLFNQQPSFGDKLENIWNKWLSPFVQLMARTGSGTAQDAANVLLSTQANRKRIYNNLMSPFQLRGQDGQLRMNRDHPLAQLQSGKLPQALDSFNRIAGRLQELGEGGKIPQVPYTQGKTFDALRQASPELEQIVSEELGKVRPPDRGAVLAGFNAALDSYNIAGNTLVKAMSDHFVSRLGRLVQTLNPTGYKDAKAVGAALMSGDQRVLAGMKPEQAQAMAESTMMFQAQVKGVADLVAQRPWFMSEQRTGQWIVKTINKDGVTESDGARDQLEAKSIARKLQSEGSQIVEMFNKNERYGDTSAMVPVEMLDRYTSMEQQATNSAIERIRPLVGDTVVQQLMQEFKPAMAIQHDAAVSGLNGKLTKRQLVGGRERLNYIAVLDHYAQTMSSSVANRQTKDNIKLIQNDPQIKAMPDVSAQIDQQLLHVLTPQSSALQKLKTLGTAYFLAGNVSSALVECAQGFISFVPELIRNGDSIPQAYLRLSRSLAKATSLLKSDATRTAADRATTFSDKSQLPLEDQLAFYFRKFNDETPTISPYDDTALAGDRDAVLSAREFNGGVEGAKDQVLKLGSLASNGLYQGASKFMKLYAIGSHLNNKAAFISAFEQAHEKGLRGEQAYDAARTAVYSGLFGGGKANAPGLVSATSSSGAMSSVLKPAVGMMMTLQNYGLSMTTRMVHLAREGFSSGNLSPVERASARKAFGVMATTQFALAGALGMPFAAAALAGFEKLTGLQVNAAVRQQLAKLGGEDEELGATISDTVMNGFANQMLGIDVAGRTGLSNILGTSPDQGFSMKDLAGPFPSIIQNIVGAGQSAARGEYVDAAKSLVPQGFKNLVQEYGSVHDYGQMQFQDSQKNLIMKPTQLQSVLYAIGFRPKELRQYQQASSLIRTSDKLAGQSRGRDTDRLAQSLLQGDMGSIRDYIQQQTATNPSTDPRVLIRDILDKAADMSQPNDLLASGGQQNAEARRMIASTFPAGTIPRRSELNRLQFREQMMGQLGYPFGAKPAGAKEYMHAALVDQMIQQYGLTRAEADRQAALVSGARQYPSF